MRVTHPFHPLFDHELEFVKRRRAAGRVPLAGLLLAMPALEATGLLDCAATVFGGLPNGFYGLDTMLVVEGVLRALAGEPRAEGASRVDPVALGAHLSRLKFPAPATVETWVSDAAGDPVLVVMAQPRRVAGHGAAPAAARAA